MKKIVVFTLIPVIFIVCMSLSVMAGGDLDYDKEGTWEYLYYGVYNNEISIMGCNRSVKNMIIPSEIEGYPVKRIATFGIRDDTLESITIPESVTVIEELAFDYCNGFTSIIVHPDNNEYASEDGILFNKEKTSLIRCPSANGLTSYTIPNSVNSIEYKAFYNCSNLSSINIPDNVKSIGVNAFGGCTGLTTVIIPDNVTDIGNLAFADCTGLVSMTFPNNATNIGWGILQNCTKLTHFTFPTCMTKIELSFLRGCTDVSSVLIPNSVIQIDSSAFYETNISTVYYLGTEEEWKTIDGVDSNKELLKATVVFCKTLTDDENAIFLRIGDNNALANGKIVANDVAPLLTNSRTMLPARFVAEQLGATVTWKETGVNQGQVTIANATTTIVITIGANSAIVNGKEITLDSPAFIQNGRTYTPVRFICENLGANVNWDDKTQTVIITKA